MDCISPILKSNYWARALAVVLACAGALTVSASPRSNPTTLEQSWPDNGPAQRDFATSRLHIDRTSTPARVWLISKSIGGVARAVEFFSGEQVDTVHVTSEGERITFVDSHGHKYSDVRTSTFAVNLDDPSNSAGWKDGNIGHDVVFGYLLAAGDSNRAERAFSDASPGREKEYFAGQASCEPQPYVARPRGSRYQASEDNFVARTKILADFDRARTCWTSKPLQVMDLEDNTFLLITQDRVFRIKSKDMTPAGLAPDLKIVDVPAGDLSTTYYACVHASKGVTLALNDCIGTEHDAQDKRLNAVYQRLRSMLSPQLRNDLRDEERAWIVRRDQECAADKGGTANLLDANQCLVDQTARRAALLEGRLAR